MGNITFVNNSTTLQLCGSFIFKSNKKAVPRVACLALFFGFDVGMLIREVVSRDQGTRAASVSKLAADWEKHGFGLEKPTVLLAAVGLRAHAHTVW